MPEPHPEPDPGSPRTKASPASSRTSARPLQLPGPGPAEILAWLKSRWREENFLKYASENYGIDKICVFLASIETNTKIVDNSGRISSRMSGEAG